MSYEIINNNSTSKLLITVEHASGNWPETEPIFGLEEKWSEQHYAYDRGARDLAVSIANTFNCSAILGSYSRILVDLNRIPGDPNIIAHKSIDGKDLPMNKDLSEEQQDKRLSDYYVPYHNEIRRKLYNGITHHLSIHSYTSKAAEEDSETPLKLGIQYPIKNTMVQSALDYFNCVSKGNVGDNKPYNLREVSPGAISLHSAPFGIETVEFEFRDDQLTDQNNKEFWSKHISTWLQRDLLIQPK